MIWRREKPISSRGTAIAGGGGEVDSLLLGSDRAGRTRQDGYNYNKLTQTYVQHTCMPFSSSRGIDSMFGVNVCVCVV